MRNVNLYQPERRSGLLRPSPLIAFGLLGLLVAGVLLDGAWLLWQQRQLQQAVAVSTEAAAVAEAALTRAEAAFQPVTADDSLQQELQQLRAEHQQLDWLSREALRQRSEHGTGFSGLLEALSQRHLPGLWLDQLAFTRGGQHIELQGVLTRPELMTAWLQSLGNDGRLGGREFARLELLRDEAGSLRFHLASEPAVEAP